MAKKPEEAKPANYEQSWTFDELWNDLAAMPFTPVQQRDELEWMFAQLKGMTSYLEIGTSFGGSLYVLGHALAPESKIVWVDLPKHYANPSKLDRDNKNRENRLAVSKMLRDRLGHSVTGFQADSHAPLVVEAVEKEGPFEAVFIDGDHSADGVRQDWEHYGPMGEHVFFHDICTTQARVVYDTLDEVDAIRSLYGIGRVVGGA